MDSQHPDRAAPGGAASAATLGSVGDAVLIADGAQRVTHLSPVAEMLTGWTTEEAEGRLAWEVLQLRDGRSGGALACPVERIVGSDPDARSDGERTTDGVAVLDRDGTSRPVSYAASAVRRPDERLSGVVVVFHAKPVEIEDDAEADRLRLIARAVNDAAWDLDVDTGRFHISVGACSVLGLEPSQAGTEMAWWIDRIHPSDRERVADGYARARREGKCFQQEYRLLARGDCCAVLERGYVVRDREGAPVRIFAALMDFTERRAAQDRLERLNESLEREVERRIEELRLANADLERFSYSVSHDLRAPLRNIASSALTVKEETGEGLSPDGREALDRVVRSARRMSDLIESLLRHATLAHVPLDLGRVSLTDLARSVAADAVRRQECDAEVAVQEGMVVEGDAGLLAALLENLIGNACKFSAKGASPRIEIGRETQAEREVFFVRDNGVGFDPAKADRLFEPFQRLHLPEAFPGTGIGLANVRRTAERHGGEVWAEGRTGEGATFYFTLA